MGLRCKERMQRALGKKRMTCWQCRRYDQEARRCLDGKVNPRSKSDTFTVTELFGLQALCHYNPYRDDLAARMFFPGQAPLTKRPLTALWDRRIEIEILPDEEEVSGNSAAGGSESSVDVGDEIFDILDPDG